MDAVFQRRIDGSSFFYRTWLDYYTGFGDIAGEFWLGNEYISQLAATDRHLLRVDLEDWSEQNRFAEYADFKIADASDKYRLTVVGVYVGNAGDSLSYHRGFQFSTYDQDNDELSTGSCAEYHRGGWWYGACSISNLNGEYNNTVTGKGINWLTWTAPEYSLRFTEMKIRPITF